MAMIKVESIVTGKVWKIEKQVGERVAAAEPILILESMKMEIEIEAPAAGTVRTISVAEGDSVAEGQVIVTLET